MKELISYRLEKDGFNHPVLVAETTVEEQRKANSPENAVSIANSLYRMDRLAEEIVVMLALDNASNILGAFEVSHGTVNQTQCTPRELLIRALVSGASSFIILHNHPSGSVSPSEIDRTACERISSASAIIGIRLSDFIIVGDDTYYSFREQYESCLF